MRSLQNELSQTLSKEEAAAYLSKSIGTINRLIYSGKIPYLKIGQTVRIEKKELEAIKSKFLNTKTV